MKYPTEKEHVDMRKARVTGRSTNGIMVRLNQELYAVVAVDDMTTFYNLSGPANKSHVIPGLYEKLAK